MESKLNRKQRTEQKTRHTILASGVRILQSHGLKNFTMDKVAEHAGIAKGTLYLYFKNKNDLLLSVADYCFKPLHDEVLKIFTKNISPVEKLQQYISETTRHTEQNRALFYELKIVWLTLFEKVINDTSSIYWEMVHIFAQTFEDGVTQNLLRPMDTEKVALFFIDSIDRVMFRKIFSKANESAEDDASELLNIYLHGLAL
ncbi:TetR/AcrR family transcriptional regulator [Halodesulfovibrio aestuarii]|nr:TetR/AcrR family transcriptional regulator [Halodesulfovibrio aestuarii]